ncbi:hypothetical protein [Altererythrobacter lauratis]|uniref:Uncharacterized protein n=1 Tax=Alteraurantiacibacter lauratis TaxID=2054627 RepID=A0ABV7EAS9_9SPHN
MTPANGARGSRCSRAHHARAAATQFALTLDHGQPLLLHFAPGHEFAQRLVTRQIAPGLGKRCLLCLQRCLGLGNRSGFGSIVDPRQHLSGGNAVSHIEGEGNQFAAQHGADIHLQARADVPVDRQQALGGRGLGDEYGDFLVPRRQKPVGGQREDCQGK